MNTASNTQPTITGGNVIQLESGYRKTARNLWRALIPTMFGLGTLAIGIDIYAALHKVNTNWVLLLPFIPVIAMTVIGAICDHKANQLEGGYRQ